MKSVSRQWHGQNIEMVLAAGRDVHPAEEGLTQLGRLLL